MSKVKDYALHKETIVELIKESKQHDFTKQEIEICYGITTELMVKSKLSAAELSHLTGLAPQDVRKYIQLIRRHANLFLDDGLFLIADNKGYSITSNKKKIEAFYQKTMTRYQNTTPQLLQMKRVLNEQRE